MIVEKAWHAKVYNLVTFILHNMILSHTYCGIPDKDEVQPVSCSLFLGLSGIPQHCCTMDSWMYTKKDQPVVCDFRVIIHDLPYFQYMCHGSQDKHDEVIPSMHESVTYFELYNKGFHLFHVHRVQIWYNLGSFLHTRLGAGLLRAIHNSMKLMYCGIKL